MSIENISGVVYQFAFQAYTACVKSVTWVRHSQINPNKTNLNVTQMKMKKKNNKIKLSTSFELKI